MAVNKGQEYCTKHSLHHGCKYPSCTPRPKKECAFCGSIIELAMCACGTWHCKVCIWATLELGAPLDEFKLTYE